MLCKCGCSQETVVYRCNNKNKNEKRGESALYCRGHRMRDEDIYGELKKPKDRPNRSHKNINPEELLENVRRVIEEHGKQSTTYRYFGKHSLQTVLNYFGPTWEDVLELVSNNNLVKSTKKERNCLKCNKKFLSQGIENRICATCKEINESSVPFYSLGSRDGRVKNFHSYSD